MKIPKDLRGMTLGELSDKWGGSWAGTLQRIARERIEERDAKDAKIEEEVQAGKRLVHLAICYEGGMEKLMCVRKRGTTTADNSPVKSSKNGMSVSIGLEDE